jgi:DNA end-binding protein Ku
MVDEQKARVVDAKHKGRGYELSKNHYVPIEEDELKAVEIESNHTVDITGFIPKADIDKRYLDTHHARRKSWRGRLRCHPRLAHREHVIALEPLGKGLLGTTLRYDYEVRDEKNYFSDVPSPRISKDMVNLASHILATKETKFDPRRFKDEYEKALKKLVRRKPRAM